MESWFTLYQNNGKIAKVSRFSLTSECIICGEKIHARSMCRKHYRQATGENKKRYLKVKSDPILSQTLKNAVANYRKTERYKDVKRKLDRKYYDQNKTEILEYRSEFNELERFGRRREEILKRDGYKCRVCMASGDLVIHHRDGEGRKTKRPNNNIANLVTLCRSCHMKIHNPTKGLSLI